MCGADAAQGAFGHVEQLDTHKTAGVSQGQSDDPRPGLKQPLNRLQIPADEVGKKL